MWFWQEIQEMSWKIICAILYLYPMKFINNIIKNQHGMGLSTKIALGFGGAVLLVFIIAMITFFVQR